MPTLETKRLSLREYVAEDLDALGVILSDPETMRYYPAPFDRTGVIDWIERNRARYANDGFGLWAMVLNSTSGLIGDCGLVRQSVDGVDEIEIGYHVRRDLWGRGLAPDAACACRDYGFDRLRVDRLISLIRPENLPSRRVAEKMGMTVWKEVMWREIPHYVYCTRRNALRR